MAYLLSRSFSAPRAVPLSGLSNPASERQTGNSAPTTGAEFFPQAPQTHIVCEASWKEETEKPL